MEDCGVAFGKGLIHAVVMNPDDLRAHIVLTEAVLEIAELQLISLKVYSETLKSVASLLAARAKLNQMEDGYEKSVAVAQLDELEREFEPKIARVLAPLQNSVARTESNHEKLEALLAALKKTSED